MISRFTKEELEELAEFDKLVDKGEDPYPLTAEQKQIVRSMTSADRKVTVYNFQKRERKKNDDKRDLIQKLSKGLDGVSITNEEREFTFIYNDVKYKVVLSVPRT